MRCLIFFYMFQDFVRLGLLLPWIVGRTLQRKYFSSVTQLCPVLYYPMDCSTLGFPVHHQLPELA